MSDAPPNSSPPVTRSRWFYGSIAAVLLAIVVGLYVGYRVVEARTMHMYCGMQMEFLVVVHQQYSRDFGDQVPTSFAQVFRYSETTENILVSPSTGTTPPSDKLSIAELQALIDDPTHQHVDYVFVRTLPASYKAWTPQHVVAFDLLRNHGNGIHVVTADAKVHWLESNGKDGPADVLLAEHAKGVVPLLLK